MEREGEIRPAFLVVGWFALVLSAALLARGTGRVMTTRRRTAAGLGAKRRFKERRSEMFPLYHSGMRLSTRTAIRIIITLICLILAVLAGIWLGGGAKAQGGGFGWPYHSYLPTIRSEPLCPRGCCSPAEGKAGGCWIKGVVTGMGHWLYYTPEMEDWCDARLMIKYRGRWFCTKQEAKDNGFMRACKGLLQPRWACPAWPEADQCYD